MDKFVQKYTTLLQGIIAEITLEQCEGCREQYANQLGHSCLTLTEEEKTFMYFEKAFKQLHKKQLLTDLSQALNVKMLGDLTDESIARHLVGGEGLFKDSQNNPPMDAEDTREHI